MILIFSETVDITTDRVMEWMQSLGYVDIVRINKGSPIFVKKMRLSNNTDCPEIVISVGERDIDINNIDAFWYRRAGMFFEIEVGSDFSDINSLNVLRHFYSKEWGIFRDYFFLQLNRKPHIGNYFKLSTNKLHNLTVARSCGLAIPETCISSYEEELFSFKNATGECITKPISETIDFKCHDHRYSCYTKIVNEKQLEGNATFSTPQLLQYCIDKWIDIRIFIFLNKVYSMAIFSKNNKENANVDSRIVSDDEFQRKVPYRLPNSICQKLLIFMSKIGLDTGSIDMVLDKEGNYIFLEVNPVGVIDMLTTPCNYNIEKLIAETLIRLSNEK